MKLEAYKRTLNVVAAGVMSLSLLAACGDDGGGAVATAPGGDVNCFQDGVVCSSGQLFSAGAFLAQATGRAFTPLHQLDDLRLSFLAVSDFQVTESDQHRLPVYDGLVNVVGSVSISNTRLNSHCSIQEGDYAINYLSNGTDGTWTSQSSFGINNVSSAVIQNVLMRATHADSGDYIDFEIEEGEVESSSNSVSVNDSYTKSLSISDGRVLNINGETRCASEFTTFFQNLDGPGAVIGEFLQQTLEDALSGGNPRPQHRPQERPTLPPAPVFDGPTHVDPVVVPHPQPGAGHTQVIIIERPPQQAQPINCDPTFNTANYHCGNIDTSRPHVYTEGGQQTIYYEIRPGEWGFYPTRHGHGVGADYYDQR